MVSLALVASGLGVFLLFRVIVLEGRISLVPSVFSTLSTGAGTGIGVSVTLLAGIAAFSGFEDGAAEGLFPLDFSVLTIVFVRGTSSTSSSFSRALVCEIISCISF